MDAGMNDFRIALRQYVRQRGFALTVVCTLAVTVGATTAVFSVVNTVLVRALPFSSPERLVWIASVRPDNPSAPFSLPEFMDYRSRTRTLSGPCGVRQLECEPGRRGRDRAASRRADVGQRVRRAGGIARSRPPAE